MRNRKKQRILRKIKEKGLSPRDETGLLDPTPYEAVKRIIEEEKAKIKKMTVEELEAYYRRVVPDPSNEELMEDVRELVEKVKNE